MTRTLVGVLLLFAATVATAEEVAWFDPPNCDACKPMAQHPDLMTGVQWEIHKLENGFMMVGKAPDGLEKKFEEVSDQMHAAAEKAMVGGAPSFCGFCQSYGALMQAGAKVQEVKTALGIVTLVTGSDAEVVKKIHAHADRTQSEMDKMAMAF